MNHLGPLSPAIVRHSLVCLGVNERYGVCRLILCGTVRITQVLIFAYETMVKFQPILLKLCLKQYDETNSMYQWYGEAAKCIVYLEFATCGRGQPWEENSLGKRTA
jgi:hypothetical protein